MRSQGTDGFRHRFMALSLAVHASPFVALPFLLDEANVSPPPTPNPIGVSLVYLPPSPTSAPDEQPVVREEGSQVEQGDELTPDALAALPSMPELLRVESREQAAEVPQPVRPESAREARREQEAHEAREAQAAQAAVAPREQQVEVTRRDGQEQARTYLAGVEVLPERVEEREPADAQAEQLVEKLLREQQPADAPAEAVVERAMVAALSPTTAATQREQSEAKRPELGLRPEAAYNRHGAQRTQQDREAAIARIREKIQRVMPLVYWNTARREQRVGEAVVRFRLNAGGYVAHYELVDSSGDLDVDGAARAVLHLAEPYVYVPGWIELALAFRG